MTISTLALLVIIGAALLLFGRSLFWVYIGLLGFLLGFEASQQYFDSELRWLPGLVGFTIGLLAALASVAFQYLAVGIGGFLGGAYLTLSALGLGMIGDAGLLPLLAMLVGGTLGALLFVALFDPALIVLSAATGASLLVQAFTSNPNTAAIMWLALMVFGVIFQVMVLDKSTAPKSR